MYLPSFTLQRLGFNFDQKSSYFKYNSLTMYLPLFTPGESPSLILYPTSICLFYLRSSSTWFFISVNMNKISFSKCSVFSSGCKLGGTSVRCTVSTLNPR
uniref:Uncharacterized protein n=1 Tax=Cacopsylla melanoneura TaxID=428564 RepID=A0A8D9ABH0_9HEMI